MKDKWNWILAIEAIILILLIGYILRPQPCTLSFQVIKGTNFNQPYPVYDHCGPTRRVDVIK